MPDACVDLKYALVFYNLRPLSYVLYIHSVMIEFINYIFVASVTDINVITMTDGHCTYITVHHVSLFK